MKRIILLTLFLIGILPLTKTYVSAQTPKQVRDSIFQKANSIPEDSLRSEYLRSAFQQYIGQESATEYLDSAYALCIRKKLQNEALWTLFDYCRHYEYRAELPKLEQKLSELKEISYQYKNYVFYYTMRLSALQVRCAQGDTEYAIIQAKGMKVEAIRLKFEGGIFIASLALAQAYDYASRWNEAIATYRQVLKENPLANDAALNIIYGSIAEIYQKQKKFPEAIHELQKQYEVIKKVTQSKSLSDTHRSIFLKIEISFCKNYMQMEDKENLNLHLKEVDKYYDKNSYSGAYIDYHALRGSYYKLTKEWDKCFREFGLALSACRGANPFEENQVLKMQATALMDAGDYKGAAEAYKTAAIRGDSLNDNMLKLHKEALHANYKIQNALLEKELLTRRHLYIQVGAATIILIILIFVIMRAFFIRRQLQHSEEETRRVFETMEATDKMKECFLHNITYEIRIPLNTVVGFSELLSSENGLTDEEITEYSAVVKNNSQKLLALINNILDLSRLEAGMMRFNVQQNDIVQLCREAKMMVEMEKSSAKELMFNTKLECLDMEVDSKWFLKLLTTLFTIPKDYKGEAQNIEYSLSEENGSIKIIVKNSPLYLYWEDEQEQHILHDINRLYIERFKGSYQVLKEGEETQVLIVYPIS